MTKQMLQHNIDDSLYSRIAEVIESSRQKVAQTANIEMVYCYYQVGRMIVEDEQKGRDRADYGEKTLQTLSAKLTEHYGKGFSYPNLRRFRQFYLAYSSQLPICSTVMSKSKQVSSHQNSSTVMSQLQEVSSKQPNGKLPIANSKTENSTEKSETLFRILDNIHN